MAHPHNSGSTLRVFFFYFLKFCRMKGANRYMKISLVVFREKTSFGANWSFQLLGHFLLLDWACSNWTRSLLIESLNSQDVIRILKQWRHDLSRKHLCVIYSMDIMWCLCGGQDSWFCKASLWICYVSLFECKNCYKVPCVDKRWQN